MCIDLKSFYASVECRERGLDPITTNLVVADASRTEKTICLAVSPALKSYGIKGRARLFEVIRKIKEVNNKRQKGVFIGSSYDSNELKNNPNLKVDFLIATPRMSYYIKYSTRIYNVYLKYLSPEDIYVYSIDEVFCDITNYLSYYKMTPKELVTKIIQDVYETTGITATAGIGSNLYLAKVAMDIVAKHIEPNEYGVRIAEIDEMNYRKLLWNHKPLTDFWRVGRGYAKKLENYHLYTMGDIARCSIEHEELLYKLFGINAELLIDHAWGYEPVTIKDIKNYKPNTNSISSGQVLHCAYDYTKTMLVVREMADLLALNLVDKRLVTDQIVLTIGYDADNLDNPKIKYTGEIVTDFYGRYIPKSAHGTIRLKHKTSSSKIIMEKVVELYKKIVDEKLLIKRINIAACELTSEEVAKKQRTFEQLDLFTNYENVDEQIEENKKSSIEENKLQHIMLDIKKKYGKNAILKAMNLEEGATTIERNKQIGGHKE